MKKFLYEIFTADTDSTSYKKGTLNFLLASIAPIVLFFICKMAYCSWHYMPNRV
ncbi:MAG: hypothetical protein J6Y42_00060 [Bacilli bacterium]|nr:hypothetical protein [Bacilli bacterium]